MKAIIWTDYGPPEVLLQQDIERPVPGDDEVLIRIHAANVFPGDAEMRRFQMHPSMWLPIRLMFGLLRPRIRILGQELAGVVEAVGAAVTEFQPGDQIFGATGAKFGSYAEYVCLPAGYPLVKKPSGISFEDASTIAVGGGNALHFIRKARLEPGESIVINGACGSIGTWAVQLAKLEGAEVTAVDSADKLDALKAIGADHVIDYEREDFTAQGKKYDVLFDVVGKSPYSRSIACLEPGGRYLLANHGLTVMLRGVITSKLGRARVISALANPGKDDLAHLARLVAEGKISAVIDQTYPLEQTVDAHRYVDSGRRQGHVVLTVGSAD